MRTRFLYWLRVVDGRFARRLCDEAPSAYKDIQAVMRALRELTRIDRKLRPLLSHKGC
ncbi:MAG TPA: RtcB family protein [Pirellulaceae bacterium]|nr:RtcB family protein [Pirellulaceae bacterium]